MTHDPVDHPSHYTSDPSGIECIQVTRHRNFNIGNAIKYLWRAGLKDPADPHKHIEDLKKAVWYINDEIDRLDQAHQKLQSLISGQDLTENAEAVALTKKLQNKTEPTIFTRIHP